MAAANLRNAVRPRILLVAAVALGIALNVWLRRQLFEIPEGAVHQVVLASTLCVLILTGAAAAGLTFQIARPHGSSTFRTSVGVLLAILVGALCVFMGFYWPMFLAQN
jgi:drug/metabolite transporter (DMT)-like permease